MSVNAKALREQRAQVINEARSIFDGAKAARREPTPDEQRRFDAAMSFADSLEARYSRMERLEAAEQSIRQRQGRQTAGEQPGQQPGEERRAEEQYEAYCRGEEIRALSADSNPAGGYMVAPQEMAATLIKGVDDYVWIRQLATKFTLTSSESLGAPSLDSDPDDAVWTAEIATGNEDTAMAFGKRELHPHALAKRIKVSNKLLMKVPSAAALVQDRLAYKFAISAEKAYLTGHGAGQPLGLFTASSDGISTGRDVSAGNTATAITMDGLINALYALKGPYQKSKTTRWLFHRDALKMIRKLRDDSGAGAGTGSYLWQPSVIVGQPDTLLNIPVMESEYVPNTFTTGLYVGLIGDFTKYFIADSAQIFVQRLNELYAETNQTGFIGRLETDGMPVLEEAFARVKLA